MCRQKGLYTRHGGTGFTLSTWEAEAGIEALCGLGSRLASATQEGPFPIKAVFNTRTFLFAFEIQADFLTVL